MPGLTYKRILSTRASTVAAVILGDHGTGNATVLQVHASAKDAFLINLEQVPLNEGRGRNPVLWGPCQCFQPKISQTLHILVLTSSKEPLNELFSEPRRHTARTGSRRCRWAPRSRWSDSVCAVYVCVCVYVIT